MLVVGLTGGIGTGKTTVAALLARRGADIVDCDGLGRLVLQPGGRAYDEVVEQFGPAVVADDASIDRLVLARIVFGDPLALARLNAITHPAIDVEIAERIRDASAPVVVLDMAVLVESELGAGQYQRVVVVEAPLDLRLVRLEGRGVPRDEALARMGNQASDDERRRVADHVVFNDGDLDRLDAQVEQLWHRLLADAAS